jgi:hypothetical protein
MPLLEKVGRQPGRVPLHCCHHSSLLPLSIR